MNFINTPYIFYLLISLLVLVLVFVWASYRRYRTERLLAVNMLSSNASSFKRRTRQFLFFSAWLLVLLAAMRPFAGTEDIQRTKISRNIIMVLDISKSMNVEDAGKMTRLNYAKWWAREFIKNHPDDRIGLISFGGTSFLECPMTRDRSILLHKLEALNTGFMPVGGTDIELALKEVLNAGKSLKANELSVIMLSDGDEVYGKYQVALKELQKKKIRVHVIGIGSPHKAGVVKNKKGEAVKAGSKEVTSKSDGSKLSAISRETKGTYVSFKESNMDFSQSEISEAVAVNDSSLSEETDVFSKPREYFQYPLMLAVILLIIRMFIGERKRSVKAAVLIGIVLMFNISLQAQTGSVKWFKEYENALQTAQAQKKPLLLSFGGSDWNRSSLKMQEEIFSTHEFAKWAKKRVILLDCDLPRKKIPAELRRQNRELAERFKADKIPSIVLLSYEEKILGRSTYYEGGAKAWTERIDKILAGNKRLNKSPSSFDELSQEIKDELVNDNMSSQQKALNFFNYALEQEAKGIIDGREQAKYKTPAGGIKVGAQAPEIDLYDWRKDKTEHLSDYLGQVVYLDFWTSWCGPCQGPMEKYNELMIKNAEKWKGRAAIIGLSCDRALDAIKNHLEKRQWYAVKQYWDKGSKAAKAYEIRGFPTAVLIDQQGKIVWMGHPAVHDAEKEINRLLENSEPQAKAEPSSNEDKGEVSGLQTISKDSFSLLNDLYSNAVNFAEDNVDIAHEAELKLGVLSHEYGRGLVAEAPDQSLYYYDEALAHYQEALIYKSGTKDVVNNILILDKDRQTAQDKVDLKKLLDEAVEITGAARKKEKELKEALDNWVATNAAVNDERIMEAEDVIKNLSEKAESIDFERKEDFKDAWDDIVKAPEPHGKKFFKESHQNIHDAYMHLLDEQQRQEEERRQRMQDEQQQPQQGQGEPDPNAPRQRGPGQESQSENDDEVMDDEGEEDGEGEDGGEGEEDGEGEDGGEGEEDGEGEDGGEGEISKKEGRSLLRSMDNKRSELRDRLMRDRAQEAQRRSNYGKGKNDR